MGIFFFSDKTGWTPFGEYLTLDEGIKPRSVPYGLNIPEFDNEHTSRIGTLTVTNFSVKNDVYIVISDSSGGIAFGRWAGKGDPSKIHNCVMDQSLPITDSVYVFSAVFGVILELLKWQTPKNKFVYMEAAHPRLGIVYSRLAKNKLFLNHLLEHGWVYVGEIDSKFTFERVTK